jgi:hypothetical protein
MNYSISLIYMNASEEGLLETFLTFESFNSAR